MSMNRQRLRNGPVIAPLLSKLTIRRNDNNEIYARIANFCRANGGVENYIDAFNPTDSTRINVSKFYELWQYVSRTISHIILEDGIGGTFDAVVGFVKRLHHFCGWGGSPRRRGSDWPVVCAGSLLQLQAGRAQFSNGPCEIDLNQLGELSENI